MSTTGRAADLLLDWRDHPKDCPGQHGWGDDSGTACGLSALDVLDQLRELFTADRDVALSEAQEAVHVARFDHRTDDEGRSEGRARVGGPDSFYNGVRHAERVIADLRGGDPSPLAIERRDLEERLEEANAELAHLRTRVAQLAAAHAEAERLPGRD